jgi:beta-phosphoglucomutase-like phosphatase (HAD superfamily)
VAELVIFDCDGVLVDSDRISLRIQAERISTPPERCIVVEDSPFGITAAKTAGMLALGFAAATPAARLNGADAVFTSMAELPELIASIV